MPGAFHRAKPVAGHHEADEPSSKRLRHTGHRTASGTATRRQQSPLEIATKLALLEPHGATSGTKLALHAPRGTSSGTKLALHTQNGPISSVLLTQGEFCPVCVTNKPSRANFLPHKPQHRRGHERNNTPAQHTKPRDETFIAPARHKQAKFTHFHHAGANFLSHHTPTPGRHFFQPTPMPTK